MNTLRLEVAVNAFQNSSDFDVTKTEYVKYLLACVSHKDFMSAAYYLKEMSSAAALFYPEEYRNQLEFYKVIKIELSTLGKVYYHQEVAKRIDFVLESSYFNVDSSILLPAISYENKKVLSVDKLDDAVVFYDDRKQEFDSVISTMLKEIKHKHELMTNYGKDL